MKRNRFFSLLTIICTVCAVHLTSCGQRQLNQKQIQPVNIAASDTITLGGGCFWCIEAVFERMKGVSLVESGYAGGKLPKPSYEQVCTGRTGYTEVVQLVFDTTKVNLATILQAFFTVHDPTTLNRQGADVGPQYRSVIFYHSAMQQQLSKKIIAELDASKAYDNKIVTAVEPVINYFSAEGYHQDYYDNNSSAPYCQFVVQPKVEKFEKVFKAYLKE
jgi:methionine-S-sulfoxide reductase